jgi:hypothetical protein
LTLAPLLISIIVHDTTLAAPAAATFVTVFQAFEFLF